NDQKDLAFETLDAYIAAHPDDLPMRHHKGLRLLALDRYDAAIAEFGIVLADDPKNVAALNNLAWTYWKKGDIAKALPLAERALAEAPDSPPIEDTAALIYLDNGDVDKAIGLLESALARAPRQASFAFHLAQALDRKGNVDRAMAILEPVLQSDITFAERDEAQALLESLQNKR
ncbi:MAG: tetratricopeptide repeat protein, partial [Magnetospiraceae bacterium]